MGRELFIDALNLLLQEMVSLEVKAVLLQPLTSAFRFQVFSQIGVGSVSASVAHDEEHASKAGSL